MPVYKLGNLAPKVKKLRCCWLKSICLLPMAGVHLAARACLLSFLLCAAFAQVPSDQVESLEGLYNATNGDGWTDNTNWNTGDPCDNSWFGVVCTGDNITEVNLGGNGLTGTLPASLDLPELLILWVLGFFLFLPHCVLTSSQGFVG